MTKITFTNFFKIVGILILLIIFFYKYGLVHSLISRASLKNEAKIINSFGFGEYDDYCEYNGYIPIIGGINLLGSSNGIETHLSCQNNFTLTSTSFDTYYKNKIENILVKNGWIKTSNSGQNMLFFEKGNYTIDIVLDYISGGYSGEDSNYNLRILIVDRKYYKM
jgi:hypothetical protein